MLKVLDGKTKKLLDLADYIEMLDDDDFDMSSWSKCIAGHACRRIGSEAGMSQGVRALGITDAEGLKLFTPTGLHSCKRMEAVRTLRNFAITGEIKFEARPRRIAAELVSITICGIATAAFLATPALILSAWLA
jgi:hypothetical protein